MVVLEDAKVDVLKLVFTVAKKVVVHLAKISVYTQHQASPLTNRLQTTTNPAAMTVPVVAKIVAVLDVEIHAPEVVETIAQVNVKQTVPMTARLPAKGTVHIIVAVNVPMILAKGNVYQHVKANVYLVVMIDATFHAKPHV